MSETRAYVVHAGGIVQGVFMPARPAIDEFYLQDVEATIKGLDRVLAATAADAGVWFTYHASW